MTTQIGKITLTTFDPKRFLGLEDKAIQSMRLGYLIASATGTVSRDNPQDPMNRFTGLAGTFECQLVDSKGQPKGDKITSGVLFMPDGFQAPIISKLADEVDADGKVTRKGPDAVKFGAWVGVRTANNPAKYEWALEMIGQPAPDEYDPLASMRALLPDAFKPAGLIAAPQEETTETEKAPAGKGKK